MLRKLAASLVLLAVCSAPFTASAALTASPQRAADRAPDRQQFVRHPEWRRGARMRSDDWNRATPIDYRQQRLRRPPNGYEWRALDGNFIMARTTTGTIQEVTRATTAR